MKKIIFFYSKKSLTLYLFLTLKKHNKMSTATKFLFGFFAGALTGVSLGLLLAPEKGVETRKVLRDKFDEYSEKGKEVYEKYKTKTAKDSE